MSKVDRLERLLRDGPPEEDAYLPPPVTALRVEPRGDGADGLAASGASRRTGRVRWAALAAATVAVGVVGVAGGLLLAGSPDRAHRSQSPAASITPGPSASEAVIAPFPSVAPDAATTTGTLFPGQVAVISARGGPALLVRVRGIQQVNSAPGLGSAAGGTAYLDVTVDMDVLGDTSTLPLAWRVQGAQDIASPSWPDNQLNLLDLSPGVVTGHVAFWAPADGQVLWRLLDGATPGPQFELRAAQTAGVTPSPVASVAPPDTWTGLDWGIPSVVPAPEGGTALPDEVAPWQGGYAIVGSVVPTGRTDTVASAWFSQDGRTWTSTFTDGPAAGESSIRFLRQAGDHLVGIGGSGVYHCTGTGEGSTCDPLPVAIWTSTDGRAWTRQAAQVSFAGANMLDVAAGPAGLVVIGDTGWDHPWIWSSVDGGVTWTRVAMPAPVFAGAHLQAITAWGGGWIVVGSVGGTEPACCVNGGPTGLPAAWFSADGSTWSRATTRFHATALGELISVDAGPGGLLATEAVAGKPGAPYRWTSTDGRTWSLAPAAPSASGPINPIASDGTAILGEGWADTGPSPFFISADGVTWRALEFGGFVGQAPGGDQPSDKQANGATIVPGGVLVRGQDRATGDALVWFLRAVSGL